mmetsp:Transcript_8963/g.33811  ORF Transcript_8963/g.33811 Transcript_8963/m.33811 type:complete len:288 (-) Transcript_8963:112-975(-)
MKSFPIFFRKVVDSILVWARSVVAFRYASRRERFRQRLPTVDSVLEGRQERAVVDLCGFSDELARCRLFQHEAGAGARAPEDADGTVPEVLVQRFPPQILHLLKRQSQALEERILRGVPPLVGQIHVAFWTHQTQQALHQRFIRLFIRHRRHICRQHHVEGPVQRPPLLFISPQKLRHRHSLGLLFVQIGREVLRRQIQHFGVAVGRQHPRSFGQSRRNGHEAWATAQFHHSLALYDVCIALQQGGEDKGGVVGGFPETQGAAAFAVCGVALLNAQKAPEQLEVPLW